MNQKTMENLLNALTDGFSAEQLIFSNIASDIAVAIAAKRNQLGLSQSAFAQKLGVTQSTVSKWENADCNFTLETLIKIAQALELQLSVSLKPAVSKNVPYPVNSGNVISFPGVAGYSSSASGWVQESSPKNTLRAPKEM